MILHLIVKKREVKDTATGGVRKWNNYSTFHGGKWYTVKFNMDTQQPQVYKVQDGIFRAFVKLTDDETSEFNIKTDTEGRKIIYIRAHAPITADELAAEKAVEKQKIDEYRAKQDAEKVNFVRGDRTETPFEGDAQELSQGAVPVSNDDLPF